MTFKLSKYFPILDWGRHYRGDTFVNDGIAAVIVTIMLIPQSLAYALLAGLPPQVGLYASILPLVAYAIFGTSRTLAVGPVAVISLMTAVAAGKLAAQGSPEYLAVAILLALISGIMLTVMGLFRLGFIANFLSHPVISGFITASGILIAVSQLKHILGVNASGHNILEMGQALISKLAETNMPTLAIGVISTLFLFWVRKGFKPLLMKLGLPERLAGIGTKVGPVIAVVVSILAVFSLGLADEGVKIVGDIPKGLPPLTVPEFDLGLWRSLLASSLIIAIIGFVESISVAQTLASKRRQRIDPDQELIGLGTANIAGAFSGGYPVTGGFARSAVNFDAGAETPAAGAFTAIGIALATLFLTPLLYFLPIATLAATIIVAVLSLVDIKSIKQAWAYSKSDFAAMMVTIVLTLTLGVEVGVMSGVAISIAIYLFRSSRPHFAIVGQVPDTDHFRNIERHKVQTNPRLVTVRIDESLYFANARFMEDAIYDLALDKPELEHVILMCSAVNDIDLSALESLEAINERLKTVNIKFHLSEVKGPVMDKLKRSHLLQDLTGEVFLSQIDAIRQTIGNSHGVELEYHL
ncbi:sodium-independent anion transporter [Algimonas arctica]|uniref:Sodium-independent anion transporter n=1 Tax=Algimonas arctica TaxID=1479486 RepID=A0A8J3CRZ9_9PROT|nr:sulfate permease [Algimonas arctica]GHA92428.1 sodium-independent anion transporter [Algimonas arctica]